MWDKITGLFSSGVDKVIDSLGTAIDKNVTNDEERLAKRNELETLKETMKAQFDQVSAELEKEYTERLSIDMKADSWLAKNIRPLLLAFLTITTVGLAYSTIFILDDAQVDLIDPWVDLLKTLLITAYTFYFGSRGIEKFQAIRSGR